MTGLRRSSGLSGSPGFARGRAVQWRTPYILPPLPHCLRWLLGYRRTWVPARLSPPAAREIPPILPGCRRRRPAVSSFARSPTSFAPPGLRLASGQPAGPLLSGAPTQAHGSMKQEEEQAERERSRPPRPRLGQEKRYRKKEWNWKEENSFQRQSSSPPLL